MATPTKTIDLTADAEPATPATPFVAVTDAEAEPMTNVARTPAQAKGKDKAEDEPTKPVKADTGPLVLLVSSDEVEFRIPKRHAEMSRVIANMIKDMEGGEDEPIPIQEVKSDIMELITRWMEYHVDDPPKVEPEPDVHDHLPKRADDICDWDLEMLKKLDKHTLFNLSTASNFLDINTLMHTCCKHIANTIRGKTPEQLREYFELTDAFTPEEEEQIRRENEWVRG
jgi:S-phase kinase-associated protein 1